MQIVSEFAKSKNLVWSVADASSFPELQQILSPCNNTNLNISIFVQ